MKTLQDRSRRFSSIASLFGRGERARVAPPDRYLCAPLYTYRVLSQDDSVVCGTCFARSNGFEPPAVTRTFVDERIPADRCDRCAGRS